MTPICPHCGYDIRQDQPIFINGYSMYSPGSQLCWMGLPLNLTGYERNMCWSLMKAFPEPVRIDVLLDRMGSEGTEQNVQVFICRVRKKLAEIGAPDPFKPTRHRGRRAYCWDTGERNEAIVVPLKVAC